MLSTQFDEQTVQKLEKDTSNKPDIDIVSSEFHTTATTQFVSELQQRINNLSVQRPAKSSFGPVSDITVQFGVIVIVACGLVITVLSLSLIHILC